MPCAIGPCFSSSMWAAPAESKCREQIWRRRKDHADQSRIGARYTNRRRALMLIKITHGQDALMSPAFNPMHDPYGPFTPPLIRLCGKLRGGAADEELQPGRWPLRGRINAYKI